MTTANFTRLQIGIADDHYAVRNGFRNLLTENGFQVTITAENGQQFIKALQTASHLPDVCLIDLGMPIMNGHDTIKAIRMLWPQMKIVACSNYPIQEDIDLALSLGANIFYQKNNAPAILVAWIKAAATDRINST